MMKKIPFLILLSCVCASVSAQYVYGRFVPDRKDDFAWENEFAAYRMYGPELAKYENPSNGVDIFMKNTPAGVIDTFFYYYNKEKRPYHVQHGYGFDGYKVAHTPGMGGVVVVADGKTHVGGHYDTWQILEQTSDVFKFKLHYDSLNIGDEIVQEDIIITCHAGQVLNCAQVVLFGQTRKELELGAGLWLHDEIGEISYEKGLLTYTEDAMSDPGAQRLNKSWYGYTNLGKTHEAVYLPKAEGYQMYPGNVAVMSIPYQMGDTVTYYFGGCWSEWRDGDLSFPSHRVWNKYLEEEINKNINQ